MQTLNSRPSLPEGALVNIRQLLLQIPEGEEQTLPDPPIVESREPRDLLGPPQQFESDGHIVLVEPSANSLRVSWRYRGDDLAVARASRVSRDLCRFSNVPHQSLVRKQALPGYFVTWLITSYHLRHTTPTRIIEILTTMVSRLLEAPLDTVQSASATEAARAAAANLRNCLARSGRGILRQNPVAKNG